MFVVDRHLVPAQCHLSVPHHNEGGRHGIPAVPTYADQHKPCIEEDRGDGRAEDAPHHLRRSPHVGKRGQRHEHPHRCHQ